MKRIFSNPKACILIILIICLTLRLSFFAVFQPWNPQTEKDQVLAIDALGYHQLAISILQSGTFSYSEHGKPDGLRTPGYPLFVAAIYSVFGHSPWIVMLFQILLDTVTCLILALTVTRLMNARVAFAATLFYALDPFLIFYCSTLLSDVLFVFLLVVAFYLFSAGRLSNQGQKTGLYYGLCGLMLGIATLVRPVSTYLPFVLTLFFFAAHWKEKKQAVKYAAICIIPLLLAVTPWLVRNYLVFDRFALSTAGQWNVLFYWAEPIVMEKMNMDRDAAEKMLDAEVEKEMVQGGLDPKKVDAFQLADYHQKLGNKIIMENPMLFVKTYVKGLIFNFINLNTDGFMSYLHWNTKPMEKRWYGGTMEMLRDFFSKKSSAALLTGGLIALFLAVTYLFSLAGLVSPWNRYDPRVILFLFLMAAYFVVVTGAAGVARYKLPSLPFYLTFAGAGVDYLFQRMSRNRKTSA